MTLTAEGIAHGCCPGRWASVLEGGCDVHGLAGSAVDHVAVLME